MSTRHDFIVGVELPDNMPRGLVAVEPRQLEQVIADYVHQGIIDRTRGALAAHLIAGVRVECVTLPPEHGYPTGGRPERG